MKRTKENWTDPQPRSRNAISGLETFDGEDRQRFERLKQQQATQRAWIEQQKEEAERKKQQEIAAEKAFVKTQQQFYRERARQEQEYKQNFAAIQAATRAGLAQQMQEKKNREASEKQLRIQEELEDLEEMKRIRAVLD